MRNIQLRHYQRLVRTEFESFTSLDLAVRCTYDLFSDELAIFTAFPKIIEASSPQPKLLLKSIVSLGSPVPFSLCFSWQPQNALKRIHDLSDHAINLRNLLAVDDPTAGEVTLKVELLEFDVLPIAPYTSENSTEVLIKIKPAVLPAPVPLTNIVVDVGQDVAPLLRLPQPPNFIAGADLRQPHVAGYVIRAPDHSQALIKRVRADIASAAVPYDVYLSLPDTAPPALKLSALSRARWTSPPVRPLLFGGVSGYPVMPPLIHGRSKGMDRLEATFEVFPPNPRYQAPPAVPMRIDVQPSQLVATLVPTPGDAGPPEPSGDVPLLLEYNWVDDHLVGSFDLVVRRVGAAAEEQAVFDSSWKLVASRGPLSSGYSLNLTNIQMMDRAGVSRRCPFDLALKLKGTGGTDPVARFRDIGIATGGHSFMERGLRGIIMAETAGRGLLTVEFKPRAQSHIEADVYEPLKAISLPILVPPPLVAKLESWQDVISTVALTDPAPQPQSIYVAGEVIYASGDVAGSVANRTAAPRSNVEFAKLEIITAGVPVFSENVPAGSATFSIRASGLRKGDNLVKLSAWKPINQVMYGGPSVAQAKLGGVPPQPGNVVFPRALPAGNIVLRRSVNGIAFEYGRATSARLIDRVGGTTRSVGAEQMASFGTTAVTLGSAQLPERPGLHHLYVEAINDFDTLRGPALVLNAPSPTGAFEIDYSQLPHHPFDTHRLGHSVTSVSASIRSQYALSVRLVKTNNDVQDRWTVSDARALTGDSHAVTLPMSGELAVGNTHFEVWAENEFDRPIPDQLTLHRKRDVFEFMGNFGLLPVDQRAELYINEIVPSEAQGIIGLGRSNGFLLGSNVIEASSPFTLQSIRFTVGRKPDVDSDTAVSLDFEVRCDYVFCFGPDYEALANFLGIQESQVVTSMSRRFDISTVDQQDLDDGLTYWSVARVTNGGEQQRVIRMYTARLLWP
jgi:hypothetical protein